MFHIRAWKEYYIYVLNQQMHTGKILINIYYYHLQVSFAFATIIRVLYNNTDEIYVQIAKLHK